MTPSELERQLANLSKDQAFKSIEALLDDFNIFDAVGLTHQEIRHSTFLAFLLSPRESHTLGDQVLKEFLSLAGVDHGWLESTDLTKTTVYREQANIDVLAVDPLNNLVLLIENKIYTGEHNDQLNRYYSTIEASYGNCRIIAIYLTRNGSSASHTSFIAVSYAQVCDCVENVLRNQTDQLRPIIRETIEHYIRAVRKNIVEDDEIKALCLKVYREHKSAINEIIRHVPARESQIYECLMQLIEDTPGISTNFVDDQQWVGFVPDAWDDLQRDGFLHTIKHDNLIKTGRPLSFQFWIQPNEVSICVQVRYGTAAEQRRLFDVVTAHPPPLFKYPGLYGNKFTDVYRQVVFSKEQMENETPDKLINLLEVWWDEFIRNDFSTITKIFVDALTANSVGAPIRTNRIVNRLKELISDNESLVLDHEVAHPRCVGFLPRSWDELPDRSLLNTGIMDKWIRTGRLIYFQFIFTPDQLEILVQMRYGDQSQRERILAVVTSHGPLLEELPGGWFIKGLGDITPLYRRTVLSNRQLAHSDFETTFAELDTWWRTFLIADYKHIEKAILDGVAKES